MPKTIRDTQGRDWTIEQLAVSLVAALDRTPHLFSNSMLDPRDVARIGALMHGIKTLAGPAQDRGPNHDG